MNELTALSPHRAYVLMGEAEHKREGKATFKLIPENETEQRYGKGQNGGASLFGVVREGQEVTHELCLNNKKPSHGDLREEASIRGPLPAYSLLILDPELLKPVRELGVT